MMYRNYRKNSKIYGNMNNQYFYQFLEIQWIDCKMKKHTEHWKVQYNIPEQSTLWLLWTDTFRLIPDWWYERIQDGTIKHKKYTK